MEKFIVLPAYKEMEKSLFELDSDTSLKMSFYPALLKSAGKKLSVKDFTTLIVKALKRFLGETRVDQRSFDELLIVVSRIIDQFVKKEETRAIIKNGIRSVELG